MLIHAVAGGAVFAIVLGVIIGAFWKDKGATVAGISFTLKKVLQTAVVLLGFGLPLTQLSQVGAPCTSFGVQHVPGLW